MAAATALQAAELGYRTIVLSTDAAHSLADCFDISLSGEPKPIAQNLWGQETNFLEEIDRRWESIREWAQTAGARWGSDQILAEEMGPFAGMEELVSLLDIVKYHDSGDYDLVVVDCAPTGASLRLLNFPEKVRWYLQKVFPIQRKAARAVRPIVKGLLGLPMPDDQVFDSMQKIFAELDRMHSILTDPDKTSVRIVLNAEKMVIKEAQRLSTYLNLYGYFTDLIVCNRLLPDIVEDRYFAFWKEAQGKYHRLIEECFAPLPILSAPLMEKEVIGAAQLKLMARAIFSDDDPARVFFRGKPSEIERQEGYYVLSLRFPFSSKEDISLARAGDELTVEVAGQRRNIILPRALARLPVEGARLQDNKLAVRFKEKKAQKA